MLVISFIKPVAQTAKNMPEIISRQTIRHIARRYKDLNSKI